MDFLLHDAALSSQLRFLGYWHECLEVSFHLVLSIVLCQLRCESMAGYLNYLPPHGPS